MIAAATPLRVYVVEDSAIVQRFLRSGVESVGGEWVGSSDNAQSAIRELPRLKPDLVVVDLALMWGSGFEVLEAIQTGATGINTAAVVLTNHVAPEDRERSRHLGASHFFDKATEGWRVLELINKMAARRRRKDRPGDDDECDQTAAPDSLAGPREGVDTAINKELYKVMDALAALKIDLESKPRRGEELELATRRSRNASEALASAIDSIKKLAVMLDGESRH